MDVFCLRCKHETGQLSAAFGMSCIGEVLVGVPSSLPMGSFDFLGVIFPLDLMRIRPKNDFSD